MLYSFSKKLNLSRINKDLWPYEEETYEVTGASSFEEAQEAVDAIYEKRVAHFTEVSNLVRQRSAVTTTSPVAPAPNVPPAAPTLPFAPHAPAAPYPTPPVVSGPQTGPSLGVSSNPPADFA